MASVIIIKPRAESLRLLVIRVGTQDVVLAVKTLKELSPFLRHLVSNTDAKDEGRPLLEFDKEMIAGGGYSDKEILDCLVNNYNAGKASRLQTDLENLHYDKPSFKRRWDKVARQVTLSVFFGFTADLNNVASYLKLWLHTCTTDACINPLEFLLRIQRVLPKKLKPSVIAYAAGGGNNVLGKCLNIPLIAQDYALTRAIFKAISSSPGNSVASEAVPEKDECAHAGTRHY
jgi:hypothetical protein